MPAYDTNGNVHAMIKASNGAIAVSYEYDAFGRTLREHGEYKDKNPFRFSTKYTDLETGLIYYGLRYYSPSLGRFINRDPIGERGGLNLYAFVDNNGVSRVDYLGMETYPNCPYGYGIFGWGEYCEPGDMLDPPDYNDLDRDPFDNDDEQEENVGGTGVPTSTGNNDYDEGKKKDDPCEPFRLSMEQAEVGLRSAADLSEKSHEDLSDALTKLNENETSYAKDVAIDILNYASFGLISGINALDASFFDNTKTLFSNVISAGRMIMSGNEDEAALASIATSTVAGVGGFGAGVLEQAPGYTGPSAASFSAAGMVISGLSSSYAYTRYYSLSSDLRTNYHHARGRASQASQDLEIAGELHDVAVRNYIDCIESL